MNINYTPLDASGSKASMAAVAQVADDELESLATHWRMQARYGERDAFGKAHMLEVGQRHRQPFHLVVKWPLPRPMAVSVSHPKWRFGFSAMIGTS